MSDNLITSDFLARDDQRTLSTLLSALLPANQEFGTPSADDPSIVEDILRTLRPASNELVMEGLGDLRKSSQERFGTPFEECSDEQRVTLFSELSRRNANFYRTLSSVLLQCYYRNDDVMRSLDMEPRPPFPEGYEIPKGDLSLLDPVRQRGKIWRDA